LPFPTLRPFDHPVLRLNCIRYRAIKYRQMLPTMFNLNLLRSGLLARLGQPEAKLALARALAAQGEHRTAFPWFVKAAKADLPAASYELGRAYLFGQGVPSSLTEALRWLSRAAAADEAEAQRLLAGLALQGITLTKSPGLFDDVSAHPGSVPNYDDALKWASQAAESGSAEAKALLGFILTTGPKQVRNQEQGEAFYKQAAEIGSAQGQLGWALVLLRDNTAAATTEARKLLEAAAGAGLPTAHYMLGVMAEAGVAGVQDFPAAAEHYRAGAALGHHPSELRLGIALLVGRGVEQDSFNAETWLRRAGLAGEAEAAAMVGELYSQTGPLPPNCFEAAIWFRRAAEAGHPGAARALGQLYLRGDGVVRDPEEGAIWLRQGVAAGDEGAMADLAKLALTREAAEADCRATFAWFQRKAEAGDLAAAFNLGICLAEGVGTRRDDALALALFRKAARCLPIAQYWCGRMLSEGRGNPLDLRAARAWFLKAAEQEIADAEVAAGEMLINGRGGPPDRSLAMALFSRAAAAGHRGGLFALEMLRRSEQSGELCEPCLAA
jgi:TPR repeat protein